MPARLAGNVKKADLPRMRVVERMNRLGGRFNLIRNVAFSGVSECDTSFIIFSFVQRYRQSQFQHLLRGSSSRGLRDAPLRTERPRAWNEAPSRDFQMERNLLVRA